MTFWFKTCPKCEGDLVLVREIDGDEVVCVQCGRQLPPAERAALARHGTLAAAELERLAGVGGRVA